jgi:outer membrane receptor protein involved in Fe transport
VIDLKFGFQRTTILDLVPLPSPGPAAFLADYPESGVTTRSATYPAWPAFDMSGHTGVNGEQTVYFMHSYEPLLNISKMAGRHSIETGFRLIHHYGNDNGIYNKGLSFDNVPTANPSNVANTGSAIASYLLGLPSSGTTQEGDTAVYLKWLDWAFYLQDNIKVSRKLTLDVGLRYEYVQWPVEKFNHLSDFNQYFRPSPSSLMEQVCILMNESYQEARMGKR